MRCKVICYYIQTTEVKKKHSEDISVFTNLREKEEILARSTILICYICSDGIFWEASVSFSLKLGEQTLAPFSQQLLMDKHRIRANQESVVLHFISTAFHTNGIKNLKI